MIKKTFTVPMYKTEVTILQIEEGDKWKNFRRQLPNHLEDEVYDDIKECVENYRDNWDGGWTASNNILNSAIIIFTGFSSEIMKYDVISHEKRHLEDKILAHIGDCSSELAAYLAGWLETQFMFFKKLETNIL